MTRNHYTSPRTDVVSVQTQSHLLAGSGGRTTPIGGEEEQVAAW